ncbi:PilW family protein [Oceanicoccus sagamiensis]|uniref:Pilus assembly protein PilW n=1 Tax=Oceanicoccus sagamiensis TaxID=716816 RepID=A0A1X9N3R4_9GAMM|nr:PilW family protein [Oceanicoccus sagamiensis]ARN72828.1 hypothetical protein BST96_01125 [Oceanicoccus sagamiensis]
MFSRSKQQKGFTLIELLVALGLGVFITAGLFQSYMSSKQLSDMEKALSRLQETGRFAMDAMARDVRMAGYQGCADPEALDIIVMSNDLNATSFSGGAIMGYETNSNGVFEPALTASDTLLAAVQKTTKTGDVFARPGTDVIMLQYATSADLVLESPTNKNSANFDIPNNDLGFSQDDHLMLSDCKSAHLLKVTNKPNNNGTKMNIAHGANNNSPHKMEPEYSEGAEILSFQLRLYFVADTGRTTAEGNPVYGLYSQELNGSPQELFEGVENLQILYGEQLDTGNIRYVTADEVTDTDNIISVRFGILAQSYDQVLSEDDSRSYLLPGETVTDSSASAHFGDRAIRKQFTMTAKLRNRR